MERRGQAVEYFLESVIKHFNILALPSIIQSMMWKLRIVGLNSAASLPLLRREKEGEVDNRTCKAPPG
jgi:hypothetical protein